MKLTFLGGAGTVTGSKYLVESGDERVLVECGLFQGLKQLRLRNWQPLSFAADSLSGVLLTHAHLDHSGYLPRLVREGYAGPIYCTTATKDLCAILLRDSARIQEEDAEYANKEGFSKHKPALPLYTTEDAEKAISQLKACDFNKDITIAKTIRARFTPSGHILGAASIHLEGKDSSINFSGDLGRPNDAIMNPAQPMQHAGALLVESTYGGREHPQEDPAAVLEKAINESVGRGGVVLIPSFTVGRAQTLMLLIDRLKQDGKIDSVPVYLDSPMATKVTHLYERYAQLHRLNKKQTERMIQSVIFTADVNESRDLDSDHSPKIIIAGSGMATGGRILHHLKVYGPNPKTAIIFAGYQAPGTRGDAIVQGRRKVKIHGDYVPINAGVTQLNTLSAHAGHSEIMAWLQDLPADPKNTFIVHGEPSASDELRRAIQDDLHWRVHVPEYKETVTLS